MFNCQRISVSLNEKVEPHGGDPLKSSEMKDCASAREAARQIAGFFGCDSTENLKKSLK